MTVPIEQGTKGSFRWMARELFTRDDARLSKKTDMWAFGMVIFVRLNHFSVIFNGLTKIQELLSREVPFVKVSYRAIPYAIAKGELPQRPEIKDPTNCEIYDKLWTICKNCWLDEPSLRPTGEEVLQILERPLVGSYKDSVEFD